MCLLHDSDEYGVCRWPLDELARAAGVPMKLVRELSAKDVLKGADKGASDYIYTPRHAGKNGDPIVIVAAGSGPCWYCSRFVRDEWVRLKRGQSTRFTPENQPPKEVPKSSPKGGIGDRQGDGPTSTSTSTVKTKEPQTPQAGPPAKPPRNSGTSLQAFVEDCKTKGERPLRDYKPLWDYTQAAGINSDYVALAWAEFCRRFMPGGAQPEKRQKDWRCAFRKYVENNYFKLWAIDKEGVYFLTTSGKQAEKFQEHKAAA